MTIRRKIARLIGYLLLAILFLLFSYALLNYQAIKIEFYHEIQEYGWIGVLAGGFLVDLIAGPIGPEMPVIGGLLAGIKIPTIVYMTALGSAAASLVIFSVGYFFGEYGALHYVSPKKYKHYKRIFIRHRRITMLLGALTPVPYVIVCLIAGVFRVRLWEFILFTIGARIIRIITALYIALLFQGVI